MIKQSHSQSGQDLFVDRILEGMRDGLFVDVGANHPIELSNTYALEQELGWLGLLVDRDDHCIKLLDQHRSKDSRVLQGDAVTADWAFGLGLTLGLFDVVQRRVGDACRGRPHIDYLSLDCDENTLPALKAILADFGKRFRVLTVETDCYRFGPDVRDAIDGLLVMEGYDIICRNVRSSEGMIYETWAVDPKLVNMVIAEKYRSDGLKWSEILALA